MTARARLLMAMALLIGLGYTGARADEGAAPAGLLLLQNHAENSSCSAVAVGPHGLLLTALHCLRNCLRAQNRMESAANPAIGLLELDVATRPKESLSCPDLTVQGFSDAKITVLATGDSLVQYTSDFQVNFPLYMNELRAHGFAAMNDDFALLQIDAPTPDCGRFSADELPPNARISALGFQQQDGRLVFDETLGFRYSSTDESAYSHLSKTPEFSSYVTQLFGSKDFIYSSTAIREGQSGGAVINDERKITGLISGHTADGQGVSEMFAVPLTHVLDKLPVDLAQQLRLENADCHSTF